MDVGGSELHSVEQRFVYDKITCETQTLPIRTSGNETVTLINKMV